jgi:hypothetical protein
VFTRVVPQGIAKLIMPLQSPKSRIVFDASEFAKGPA